MISPTPRYHRVKEAIRQRIDAGVWPAGTMIPPEPVLCAEFEVSRTTVRKAIGDLVQEGCVRAVQGKGTFVAPPKVEERFIERAFGIYEDFARRGIALRTSVLRQEVEPAPRRIADRLGIAPEAPTHVIVRLRAAQGETMLVSTTHIPFDLCPDLVDDDLTDQSLYGLLRERYGLGIARGTRRLEAVAAGPTDGRLLDVALGTPLLQLETVAYLSDGRPFEHSIALHRGDRTTVEVEFFGSPKDALAELTTAAGRPGA